MDGFVIAGSEAVYLVKGGATFQRALNGQGTWDYALAIIVWHEMAHLSGASEPVARQKEEQLWTQFVLSGRVAPKEGLAYLALLRGR